MSSISAQGVVERASAELSKRINGLGLRSKHHHSNSGSNNGSSSGGGGTTGGGGTGKTSVMERVTNVLCGGSSNNHNNINSSDKPSKLTGKQQQQISKITGGGSIIGPSNGPALNLSSNNVVVVGSNHSTPNLLRKMNHHHTPQHHSPSMMGYKQQVYVPPPPVTVEQLLYDERFLSKFFLYFNACERRVLAQVCVRWRDLLYRSPRYWSGLLPVIQCRDFRQCSNQDRVKLYNSLIRRGFHTISLFGATDEDALDLVHSFPLASKHVHNISLRCSSISDRGLEALLDHLQSLFELELAGCNEITEAGLWACLTPRIVSLSLADCINVADEAVGAVAQLLPSLYEFNLQVNLQREFFLSNKF